MQKNMSKGELHLMVLWANARHKEKEILEDIGNHLKILECYDIKWTDKSVSDNFSRFYGVKLGKSSAKAKECGTGRFLLITLWDEAPRYEFVQTSRGHDYVNTNIFSLKEKYRSWTGGGSKIHATNSVAETNHDLTLLLGINYDDYLLKTKDQKQQEKHLLNQDIMGASGWKSLDELFYVLNATSEYVVLRGFENFAQTLSDKNHGDIDLLVSDYANVVLIVNGKTCFADKRPHYLTKIGEQEIYIDLWNVKNSYHDLLWESKILKDRVLFNGFYIPKKEDYFYLLIYHATINKRYVAEDYYKTAEKLFYDLKLNEKYDLQNYEDAFDLYFELLKDFMKSNGYCFTKPNDPVVFFHEDLFQDSLIRDYLEERYFLRDIKRLKRWSNSCAGYIYFQAFSGDEKLFVKWGGIGDSCVNEYVYAAKLFAQNQHNFIKPIFFRYDGNDKTKFVAYEFMEGDCLEKLLSSGSLSNEDKRTIVVQLKNIAQTLLNADCVHRDIRPANFIFTKQKELKLMDTQFAVSASHYKELSVLKKNRAMLRGLGDKFGYQDYMWDDMYSISKVMEVVGRDSSYADEYDDTMNFVRSNIGRLRLIYKAKKKSSFAKRTVKFLSLFVPVKAWRKKLRKLV